mmetsp:Transcript_34777/g.56132  ORF Transcript_34777/g.56132 Transcript_34777/m.56132 type:complete len:218 (+) Transcript_34777:1394-2047(+)
MQMRQRLYRSNTMKTNPKFGHKEFAASCFFDGLYTRQIWDALLVAICFRLLHFADFSSYFCPLNIVQPFNILDLCLQGVCSQVRYITATIPTLDTAIFCDTVNLFCVVCSSCCNLCLVRCCSQLFHVYLRNFFETLAHRRARNEKPFYIFARQRAKFYDRQCHRCSQAQTIRAQPQKCHFSKYVSRPKISSLQSPSMNAHSSKTNNVERICNCSRLS